MSNRREYVDCCLLGCDAASFDVEDPIFGGLRLQGDDSVKSFRETRCPHLQGGGAIEMYQCCKRYFFFHIQKAINISEMLASSPFMEMVC